MPSSNQRKNANRENARQSTGPRTPQGKARASSNALKHGILSQQLILKDESADDFARLHAELVADLRPVGFLEHNLVERIAIGLWRQRRLIGAETALIESKRQEALTAALRHTVLSDPEREEERLYRLFEAWAVPRGQERDSLSRYQTMLDNELYKALRALREAQHWRQKTIDSATTDASEA